MSPCLTDIPQLTTERLILRAPCAADLDAYRAFYAVSDVTVGGYRGGRSDADVAAILDRDIAHWAAKGFGMFTLRRISDGAFLGGTGLSHPDGWPSHELTWWQMPEARGHGYATEASRAVIDWAYGTLGCRRLRRTCAMRMQRRTRWRNASAVLWTGVRSSPTASPEMSTCCRKRWPHDRPPHQYPNAGD